MATEQCSTGRSTQIAFQLLAEAYKHRGMWIHVKDHYGTHNADVYLLDEIDEIIGKLGFYGFEFDRHQCRFKLMWGKF